MDAKTFNLILSEGFFSIIGILIILNGFQAFQNPSCKKPQTTGIFWILMGLSFIFGPHVPAWITGVLIVVIAVITAVGGVTPIGHTPPTAEETRANADRIGFKVFIPALTLAFVAVGVATSGIVSANNAIGISALAAVIVALLITKAPARRYITDGSRLLDNMGPVVFLPQLLAALGALFTVCGVGDLVARGVSLILPENNTLIAVVIYCLGMAVFTMIMGNGFAAFSVITAGIAVPFLLARGADPVIVGALGLTAGYCGTLLTPMAANFNIMPAALLRMNNKYGIIKYQAPYAAVMLLVHIILMYVLAV